MEKGEPYESLNHSYVIFICNFDVFGKGCYKYTFQNRCMEEEGLELGDGSTTIFMNTGGYKGDISKDCEVFLKSIRGQFTDNDFSAILREEVEKVKKNQKWRKEYMYMSVFLHDAEKKGMAEGKTEAEKQAIKNMLQRFSPEEIIQLGYDRDLVVEISKEI